MKHGATQTAKFKRLVRQLRAHGETAFVSLETIATGILERLWHFTITSAPEGDVGKFSDEDIAEMVGWHLDADIIITILVDTGWLDRCDEHRLTVHDWHEHAPTFVKGSLSKVGRRFASEPPKDGPKVPPKVPPKEAEAKYLPNLTKHNLTRPNQTEPNKTVVSPQPDEPADVPVAELTCFDFPVLGDPEHPTWTLPVGLHDELVAAYGGVDVPSELRKARAWCVANSTNRKTARGMPKFLNGWMAREQNSGRSRASPAKTEHKCLPPDDDDLRNYNPHG